MVGVGFRAGCESHGPGKSRARAEVIAVEEATEPANGRPERDRGYDRVSVAQKRQLANAQVDCDGEHASEEGAVFGAASRPGAKPSAGATIGAVVDETEQVAAPEAEENRACSGPVHGAGV